MQHLIQELKNELSGHFQEVILGLLMTPIEFDSFSLRAAMKVTNSFAPLEGPKFTGVYCSFP